MHLTKECYIESAELKFGLMDKQIAKLFGIAPQSPRTAVTNRHGAMTLLNGPISIMSTQT